MSYLKRITEHTDVDFKDCHEWGLGCQLHLSSTKRTSCTIVQFIRKDIVSKSSLLKWPKKCITKLKIDLFSDYFIEGIYRFKMSHGPLPFSWVNPEDHDKMVPANTVKNIGIRNEPIVSECGVRSRSPFILVFKLEIYRQRHSWIEMILNISAASCVLQSINTGSLLFYSLNNTQRETRCLEQTLIMRLPEHQTISLSIFIDLKAYQGLTLPNSKKDMIYWLFYRFQDMIPGQIQVTFLYWTLLSFQPTRYTVISLPGKMYSFEINIRGKRSNELIQNLAYDFDNNINKLDNELLDFIWLDENPTIMSQFDSQSSIGKDTSRYLTFSQCLNFSQMANLYKEYYIFSWTTSNPSLKTSTLKSWQEASSLCESIKGQ